MIRAHRFGFLLAFTVGTGLLLSGITIRFHLHLAEFEHSAGLAAQWGEQIWIFGGMFIFGAVSAYASAQYRIVLPVPTAIGIYGYSLWISQSDLVKSAQTNDAGLLFTPFEMLLWGWPIMFVLVLGVGLFEYTLRRDGGRPNSVQLGRISVSQSPTVDIIGMFVVLMTLYWITLNTQITLFQIPGLLLLTFASFVQILFLPVLGGITGPVVFVGCVIFLSITFGVATYRIRT